MQTQHFADKSDIVPPISISIVLPVYNEVDNLRNLFKCLRDVLESLEYTWEVILVDDGSDDQSWAEICQLHCLDSRVKGIRFSRNYGHQYALFAGLSKSCGAAVIMMDADFQHPPHIIPELLFHWQQGKLIVHTQRVDTRDMPWFKKKTSSLFYKLFSFLSGVQLEAGLADFRLLDRQVVDSLLQFKEEGLFLRGIIQTLGYPSVCIKYQCQNRYKGKSKYTLMKMIGFAWTGITSFSIVPLRVAIIFGILTSCLAFTELAYAFYIKMFTNRAIPGWASAISIVAVLFGIMFILIGIMGEYIGRILIETRARPIYLIHEQVGVDSKHYEGSSRSCLQHNHVSVSPDERAKK